MNQFNALYSESFSDRHIGPRQSDLNAMLATIGVKSLDELIDHVVPSNIRLPKPLNVDAAVSEVQFLSMLREKASKNKMYKMCYPLLKKGSRAIKWSYWFYSSSMLKELCKRN